MSRDTVDFVTMKWLTELPMQQGKESPCLRLSPTGQQDQEQAGPTDRHRAHSASSEQDCFCCDVARCPDPKSVTHTRKSSKGSSAEVRIATANVLSLAESYLARRRDPGSQVSGRRAELDQIFHSTGLQVIGLQECPAKKARRLEGENFNMISETAGAKGRGGCELWVAKELRPDKRKVRLLHSEPELLLASLLHVSMLCFGLSCTSGVCWRTGKVIVVATL